MSRLSRRNPPIATRAAAPSSPTRESARPRAESDPLAAGCGRLGAALIGAALLGFFLTRETGRVKPCLATTPSAHRPGEEHGRRDHPGGPGPERRRRRRLRSLGGEPGRRHRRAIDPAQNRVLFTASAHGEPTEIAFSGTNAIVSNGPQDANVAVIDVDTGKETNRDQPRRGRWVLRLRTRGIR